MNALRRKILHPFGLVLVLCLCVSFAGNSLGAEESLWQALKTDNTFVLLRHTLAPGTGDPPNFNVRDCNTQRLLSDKGRDQALSIGHRFRENGIQTAEIYSSQWCRCLETAELLKLGPVEELEILNSFFRRFENREKQTSALRNWLVKKQLDTPLILVTHQVNITGFTVVYPSSGEMVVVNKNDRDNFTVIGTMLLE